MLDAVLLNESLAGDRDMAKKMSLRQARLAKLLSANELGRLSGVSASTIIGVEKGARPHFATIRKLAAVLEMAPTDIAWPGNPFDDIENKEE